MTTKDNILPVLPIKLDARRNSYLLKLKHEAEEWIFGLQPLPPERATAEFHVTVPGGRNVAGAVIQFFDKGKVAGRLTTDGSVKTEAGFYPWAGRTCRSALTSDPAAHGSTAAATFEQGL